MMIYRSHRLLPLGLLLLLSANCAELPEQPADFDNPLDVQNPDYIVPETTIFSGPRNGTVVDTNTVTFSFRGNSLVTEFAYQIDDEGWSDWKTATIVTFHYLAEGFHHFEVKAHYANGDEDASPATANFTIDDIHGPGFTFSSPYLSTLQGNAFTLDILLEEVTNVKGARAEVIYNPLDFSVISVTEYGLADGLFVGTGGEVVAFMNEDSAAGKITIELAFAATSNPTVSGTGAVATVQLLALRSGQLPLQFGPNCTLRNSFNTVLSINENGSAIIDVQ